MRSLTQANLLTRRSAGSRNTAFVCICTHFSYVLYVPMLWQHITSNNWVFSIDVLAVRAHCMISEYLIHEHPLELDWIMEYGVEVLRDEYVMQLYAEMSKHLPCGHLRTKNM